MTSSAYRTGTYKLLYVYCGAATENQLRKSFEFAAKKLAEKYKSKKNKYLNATFDFSLPSSKGIQLGFAYVFCSDWELANAICGLNLDGSLRVKYTPIDDAESVWEIIKNKSEEYENVESTLIPLELKSLNKEINMRFNKVTEAKAAGMAKELYPIINTYEKAKIMTDNICKSVKMNTGVSKCYADFIFSINETHIDSFKDGQGSIGNVILALSIKLYNMAKNDDKDKDNSDIRRIVEFVGHLYNRNLLNSEIFEAVYDAIKDDMEKVYSCIKHCIRNINKHRPKILEDFCKAAYSSKILKLEVWADEIKKQINKIKTQNSDELDDWQDCQEEEILDNVFFREALPPLVTLPSIQITNNELIKKMAAEIERCEEEGLEKEKINCTHIHLLPLIANYKTDFNDGESPNVLISRPMPNWVGINEIITLASKFSTWPDSSYPKVKELPSLDGKSKKFRIEYAKEGDCIMDASKAMCIIMKKVFYNNKTKVCYRAEFSHDRRR